MSELAQLPTPAMARRMGVGMGMDMSPSGSVGRSSQAAGGGSRAAAARSDSDQGVEPGNVAGHAAGGVLHDGAGVDVEIGAGGLRVAEALHEQGPPPLQQGEPGLGGQVPGEGQAQAEAPGVVGGPASLQQLDEEPRPASVMRYTLRPRRARVGECRHARRTASSPLSEPVGGADVVVPGGAAERPPWPPRRPTSPAG